MAAVPTVEIVNPENSEEMSIINASDFDPAVHVKWEDRDKPKAFPEVPKVDPESRQPRVPRGGATGWPSVASTPKDKLSEEKKEGV